MQTDDPRKQQKADPCQQTQKEVDAAWARVMASPFYLPAVVASMLTAFFHNATEKGEVLKDIESRLDSAIKMIGTPDNDAAKEYLQKVCAVRAFYGTPVGKELFNSVLGAMDKLLAEFSKPANRWSRPLSISQGTIKRVYQMPKA